MGKEDGGEGGWHLTFTQIHDVTLHYRARLPTGRPVVAFANSLGTDFRIWDAVVERLSPDFGYLLFDKRGHGLSSLGHKPARIETFAEDLLALLDRLEIEKASLCGLSIGGLIAQCMALDHPERVDRLILCDTAAKIGDDAMWTGRAEAALGAGIASFADGVIEKWFTPAFHRQRRAELEGYKAMLSRQSPQGYAFACDALRRADYRARVNVIAAPTLVLCGDRDGSTPPELVRTLADSIPGARFEIVRNAGHIPCVEQADTLAELIRAALQGS